MGDNGDDKVQEINANNKGNNKNPVESATNQLKEAARKKKQEELKQAIEAVIAAKTVLGNAVKKAKSIDAEIKDLDGDKLDLNSLSAALGI